ncbi:tetratricopeptide repeat protein [Caballeronia sp. LZ034LL]|uniref:tetratricopeptide repeat protein n=1 Tax=Caballeronia sp. LZ034LL TaxID=3038567 RepID=UPI00285D32A9|nr:tetratricopeptide repeat protein [Caballeronia sp. LZ034LL]MDR5837166.1 tetratricopeptide repeat protein [Caballeronia sp. LZ034LL]
MQTWHPSNPVERRLMAVHEDWLCFRSNSGASLLYWQANEADLRMVEIYVQRQRTLSNAVLRLTSRFDHAEQYARALAQEVIAFYKANCEGALANGIAADWQALEPQGETPTAYLLTLTRSLLQHHPDVFPELVLMLEPGQVSKPGAFERWLNELLDGIQRDAWQADRVRFVLIGTDADAFAWLRQRKPEHMVVVHGRYGMETLPRELLAESDQRGPQGDFQRLFVELSETLTHCDVVRLESVRAEALAITSEQGWFDQSVTVHLVAGAAYLKWNEPDQALAAYEQATQAALQAVNAGHPAGNKLAVNSLFGEASVHWMQGKYARAAERYEQAASFAQAEQDGLPGVEAWRMVGECMHQLRRQEDALNANFRALDAGLWIDPALRANSNVQHVAQQALGRVGVLHRQRSELTARLRALYGENWPETIKPLPPEAITAHIEAGSLRNQA